MKTAKWIGIVALVVLLALFIGAKAYYSLVVNPRVIEEIAKSPEGERAGIVTLLTFPDGKQIPVNYLQEGNLVFIGADGGWWREFDGEGIPVDLLIRGKIFKGHGKVVLDNPEYTHEVFARLRPNAPSWLPDWLNGKLIVIKTKTSAG